jgi:uncharacterized GH25 family protein
VLATIAIGVTSSFTLAHDFWIEPSASRIAVGVPVSASLKVGVACPGDIVRRKAERIERFELVGPSGAIALTGEEGVDPAGAATPTKPGLHAVVYRSKRVSIELAAAEFEAYLKEEGLEKVSRLRAERGESDKPGREVYSRCAKALVAVGETPADASDNATGLRYEIVATGNPLNLDITREGGATLTVQTLFEGKPLAGAKVKAIHCGGGTPVSTAITDENGRATLPIGTPGRWVIASTEMIEAPKDSGAQWESLWASLVFEVK